MGGGRRSKTSDEMDAERRESLAHEYLCRLEEARLWMSKCLADEEWARNANRSVLVSYGGCGELLQFERSLRNGLALARLAKKFAPDGSDAAKMKIFDAQLRRFEESGLDYRHTDNINCFIQVLGEMGMPQIFIPETSDVYDGKNLPRLVLCLHAVSMLLYKLGMAPQMANLSGRANFTEKELATAKATLEENQTKLPKFDEIGDMLRRERATGRMKTARLRRNFYDDKASYYHSDPGNLFKRAPYKDSLIDFQSKARDYLARDRRSFNTLGRHNFRWSGDQCDARSLPPYGHVGEMLLHQRVRGSKPRVEMPGMNSIHGGKRGGSRKTRADDSEKPRNSLVEFQARARGYLVRKKLLDCLGEDFYVCGNDNYRGIMASAAAVRERIRQKDLESLFVVKKKKPPPKPSPRKLVSDQTGPISSSSRSSGRQRVTFHTESNKEYEDTGPEYSVYSQRRTGRHLNRLRRVEPAAFTAVTLFDRGVLLDVAGVPTSQWRRDIVFDFMPPASGDRAADEGFFIVDAYLPNERRRDHVMLSQLLDAQYDGVAIKKMFSGKVDFVVAPLFSMLDGLFYKKSFQW